MEPAVARLMELGVCDSTKEAYRTAWSRYAAQRQAPPPSDGGCPVQLRGCHGGGRAIFKYGETLPVWYEVQAAD